MAWRPARDKDFRNLPDNELIVRARDGSREALNALFERHQKLMDRVIAARLSGRVKSADLPDAKQIAQLGFMEAVARYDLLQAGPKQPCDFPTYLVEKIRSRCDDAVRRIRRDRTLSLLMAELEKAMDERVEKSYVAATHDIWSASKLSDPALLAQRHEWELRAAQAIGRLDSRYAQVWQGYCGDKPYRQIALEVGVSVSTVKRMLKVLGTTVRAAVEAEGR